MGQAAGEVPEPNQDAKERNRAEAAPSEDLPQEGLQAAPVEVVEHVVSNDLLALSLTNRSPTDGGLVVGAQLRSPQFVGHSTETNAFGLGGEPTLEVSFADAASDFRILRGAGFEVRDRSDTHFTLAYAAANVEVVERFEILSGYQARLEVSVTNRSTEAQQHRLHLRTRVGVNDASRYDVQRGLCRLDSGFEGEDQGDVEDEPALYKGSVEWAGVDSKYFSTLVVPAEPGSTCEVSLSDNGAFIVDDFGSEAVTLDPGATHSHTFGVYFGPKELNRLSQFSAVPMAREGDLEQAIDWGYLGVVSESLGKLLLRMLRWFYQLTGAWGFAIVLLTVVVKVVTLPLTLKQMASMKAMKRIQPEIEKIKKKYADDRAKQGQEMQALFGRSGVNPLAGCLPLIVQLPIWVALYAMLGAVVELVHEPFLWLPDLTQQDPYYLLPLVIGATMVVQNRMMPTAGDETQAQMMRWMMPIMFTAFMLFLPSGLGIYIVVNTVLSVVQTAVQVGRKDKTAEPEK